MNNKGFTLVELLGVIAILGFILIIAVPKVMDAVTMSKKAAFVSSAKVLVKAGDAYQLKNWEEITRIGVNQGFVVSSNTLISENYLQPTTSIINSVLVFYNNNGTIETYIFANNNEYIIDGYKKENALDNVTTGTRNYAIEITASTTYNLGVDKLTAILPLDGSGANAPVLATGMIPIRWNGSAWAKADVTNMNATHKWYDYNAKQWANAVSVSATNRATYLAAANGTLIPEGDILTYMVWIPRYGYQIATGYHTSTAGTINVKFLTGTTNTTPDATPIVTVPTYSGSSQTNYIQHPAFWWDNDGDTVKDSEEQLTGIWVAKFEASGTTVAVDSKPNVASLRSLTIGTMFDATRNMETNARYGWGTSGTDIDIHMMKNSEWGAVTYLSKSIYGKETEEIWINPANNYTTGCAGDSVSSGSTTGCLRAYNTTNGVKASTTGNIFGIYDISGGAWEYTSAYINNGHSNLTNYGNSIITANLKYKEIYPITTDSDVNNYNNAINIKGDAVYETSSSSIGVTAWYADNSYMPYSSDPWFIRGGSYTYAAAAGAFYFRSLSGIASSSSSFRFVLAVGTGL